MEQVVKKQKRSLSPIWILPLLALVIGGWLIYKSARDSGIDIEVTFKDSQGITAGKSQVIFKGIPVGLVKSVDVSPDMKSVITHIEMRKEAEAKIVEDMQFWIVKPEVRIDRIAGLDTLVGGSYIGVQPGISTKPARVFKGLVEAPPLPNDTPGLHLQLRSKETVSFSAGSPIYYKKIQVGEVLTTKLSPDNSQVLVEILVYEKYKFLLNSTSVFWNASGITLEASLSRVQFQMDSLVSLLSGGISFNSRPEGKAIDDTKSFMLHSSKDDAIMSRGKKITFHFEGVEGVNAGASIRYRNIDIGEIISVELSEDKRSLTAIGYAFDDNDVLFKDRTYAWLTVPQISLGGIENISTVVKGPHVSIEPGGESNADEFIIHSTPPVKKKYSNGRTIILETDRSGSLSVGGPVYFRQVRIGEIIHIELSEDTTKIHLYVGIYEKYTALVRENSKFWNSSGITVTGGLMTEMTITTESLEALVTGGLTMATPEKKLGLPVKENHKFTLDPKPPSDWQKWSPVIDLQDKDGSQSIIKEKSPAITKEKKSNMTRLKSTAKK